MGQGPPKIWTPGQGEKQDPYGYLGVKRSLERGEMIRPKEKILSNKQQDRNGY